MKTLERYIVTEFLKLLAIATAAFILLFLLIDLFENMDNLMKHHVPVEQGIIFFIYKIPFIISQISPVAVLVSVLLSLGILAKGAEITAMKAGGVRLLRLMLPLLLFGAILSLAVMAMNETVTHTSLKKVDTFRKEWFGVQGSFGREGMWIKTSTGIVNVKNIDLGIKRLYGVTYYQVEKPFKVRGRIQTRSLQWRDGRWTSGPAIVWRFTAAGDALKEEAHDLTITDLPKPEDLVNMENLQKGMNLGELNHYIKSLEADGYEAARYKLELYNKVSFPLVNFIMVLVGIPFALKTGRHSGIAAGVGISIVIAFSYWIIFAMTRSLGQSGMVPPLVAASFPDVLFFAVGALMYGYVRE